MTERDQRALLEAAEAMERRLISEGRHAVGDAVGLLPDLRASREYGALADIAELVLRIAPDDHTSRRLYGHALIEVGKPVAALEVLKSLRRRLPEGHPEEIEASGLIGRAWKDIYLAASDQRSTHAVAALRQAFRAYKRPYERDPKVNTWHAVNLLALSAKAERTGLRLKDDIDRKVVANQVLSVLKNVDEAERDGWYWATVAEAWIALNDWDAVTEAVRAYAAVEGSQFELASTMRQFSRLWGIEQVPEGAAIVAVIKARLLDQPNGLVETSVAAVRAEAAHAQASIEEPDEAHKRMQSHDKAKFEAVLGAAGVDTFKWWQAGLQRARSVASVRQKFGTRIGTAWLATAAMFELGDEEEQVVVTNFHVVNSEGKAGGLKPEDAEIVFEAVEENARYDIERVLWQSDIERHDVTILKLTQMVPEVGPLPAAAALPALDGTGRVYVVGYPGGRDLAFSFQDNELLDHEGPKKGKPQIAGVCRIHYRAPTEGGSSGSPVFNAKLWQVIGVHHRGGKIGMPRLNGMPGSYGANEAVSIKSIAEAIAAERASAAVT